MCGAFEARLIATGDHPVRKVPVPNHGWVIGLTFDMTEVCREKLMAFIPEAMAARSSYDKKHRVLQLPNGSTIAFKSCDAGGEVLQARAIHWAWFDEEPTPNPKRIFSEVVRGLVDHNGFWWMTATPVLGTQWLAELIRRDDIGYFQMAMRDNYNPETGELNLPEEAIVEFESQLSSEDEIKIRVLGEYITLGGRPYFDQATLERLATRTRPAQIGELAA